MSERVREREEGKKWRDRERDLRLSAKACSYPPFPFPRGVRIAFPTLPAIERSMMFTDFEAGNQVHVYHHSVRKAFSSFPWSRVREKIRFPNRRIVCSRLMPGLVFLLLFILFLLFLLFFHLPGFSLF